MAGFVKVAKTDETVERTTKDLTLCLWIFSIIKLSSTTRNELAQV